LVCDLEAYFKLTSRLNFEDTVTTMLPNSQGCNEKMGKELTPALAYLRTSSAANVGADKDSDKRQRAAIEAFAKRAGYTVVGEYYDKARERCRPYRPASRL
jgi:hypothetical protein